MSDPHWLRAQRQARRLWPGPETAQNDSQPPGGEGCECALSIQGTGPRTLKSSGAERPSTRPDHV